LPNASPIIDSEVEVLGSRDLARKVAQRLELDRDPAFNPSIAPKDVNFIDRILGKPQPKPMAPEAIDQTITDRLLAGLSARRVGVTYAIDVSYRSDDPQKAARIADAFAKTYVADQLA